MTTSNTFTKTATEVKDLTANWATWLLSGEIIITSTWTMPAGITKDSDSKTDTTATVWLSAGVAGEIYDLVNQIVTNQGRTKEQTLIVQITPISIVNGYCTLDDLKQRLQDMSKRTASTISFTAGTKTIADSASGLRHFQAGDYIQVTGSTSNNGFYTVATGNLPGSLVTTEALVTEAAGQAVTIKNVIDQKDDAGLEGVIEAASRLIDAKTGTRFYTVEETRVYTACFGYMVEIDDLVTLTSLKTDPAGDGSFSTIWAAADYRLAPYNAAVNGRPYTWIETRQGGAYSFPPASGYSNVVINYNYDRPPAPQPLVQVVGAFGYSTSAPAAIKEACILTAMRLWRRKDLIYGLAGSAEMGTMQAITKLDSDGELRALLSTVKKRVIV